MKYLALFLCSLAVCCSCMAQEKSNISTTIQQISFAEESPNISNVSGNVTIIYGCVAAPIPTPYKFESFSSTSGFNSSGAWPSTTSSGDDITSHSIMSPILSSTDHYSGWHLLGTINGTSTSNNAFSLSYTPSILPLSDSNTWLSQLKKAEGFPVGSMPTSIGAVPSGLPTVVPNTNWQPIGTINGSTTSDNAFSLSYTPSILPLSDSNTWLSQFKKAEYSSISLSSIGNMSNLGDYGVASGVDQTSLSKRLTEAEAKGQEIIGWTLIYKAP